ncbi:hypothetical protein Aperf_G00000070662 [Anoplocephala perfoliata]
MGNLCASCCGQQPTETVVSNRVAGDSERERLLNESNQNYEATHEDFPVNTIPDDGSVEPQGDVTDMMTNILKGVETQVVDAGLTEPNYLDPMDYDARAQHYAAQFAKRTNLPDSGCVMARASGNPVMILAEQFLRPLDLEEIQNLANKHARLIEAMYPQVTESFVVQLDTV